LEQFIRDVDAPATSNVAHRVFRGAEIEKVLATLSQREAGVIRFRFGIGDGCPRTLEEVGLIFNVTRERVRQIEAKAIGKLRSPARTQALRDYA